MHTLAPELVYHIYEKISVTDIVHVGVTCNYLYHLALQYEGHMKFSNTFNDNQLKNKIIMNMLQHHRSVDLSHTQITHQGIMFILKRIKNIKKIIVKNCGIFETELVRKIVSSKQYNLNVDIELSLNNRKNVKSQHLDALYKAFPGVKIYRWFCSKQPLDIYKFHPFTGHDLHVTLCHECFETTSNDVSMSCGRCKMISCSHCYDKENYRCTGCLSF